MNEDHGSSTTDSIKRHQFSVLLVASVVTALFFVFVALSLYQTSGTIQLDLSRPGYAEARKEAKKDSNVYTGFSSDGPIDSESLKEFNTLFTQKQKESTDVNAFSSDVLSDVTLKLNK